MTKLNLSSVTLIAIGSTKVTETLKAINLCLEKANFNDVYFFSSEPNEYQIPIPEMKSIKDYDHFVVHKLPSYIESPFCLTIHWDGFIVNSEAWTDTFYDYDYIGAPWPWMRYICGNGGFCLKSKKFLTTQQKIITADKVFDRPDDVLLCVDYRSEFEKFGCLYAPRTIAQKFSTEYGGYYNFNSFGFHDFRPNPQFKKLLHYELR